MYLTNMVALAKKDANEAIEEEFKNRNLKVNTNILIDKLKDTLISMNNPWKRSRMLKYIQE